MPEPPPSARTRFGRHPERGTHEPSAVHAIADEARICHVGFTGEAGPVVIPTAHVRLGDALYVHASVKARWLEHLCAGAPACITITLLDGLVLARSALGHSMNYRSAVIFAAGSEVIERADKLRVLAALVDRMAPDRYAQVRPPTDAELAATRVVAFPLAEASAKSRTGPPVERAADRAWSCWAGVVPVRCRE